MITKIDGLCYINLIHSGIKNLERYRSTLNDLNVFPVPDGDTGTNMVMTLRYGYESIKTQNGSLAEISKRFSSSVVFGARGNSGVIVSQFFKGVGEVLKEVDTADSAVLALALQSGCDFAYASVSQPVEGTILTVLREASLAVTHALPLHSINEAIDIFLSEAKISLARTPELLPILKKAGVVDSGGSGIVYFFEGVKKYLNGETIDVAEEVSATEQVDLSVFNKDTSFDYGYCIEGVIQLLVDVRDFVYEDFRENLSQYGDSIVASPEGDKIKLHIHARKLAPLMAFCQSIGEFLTVKIENMTVQNRQKASQVREPQKFLRNDRRELNDYAVVAVAPNEWIQQTFLSMGADVVILSEIAPSSQDFLEAFQLTESKNILIFPNSANSILASTQAAGMYSGAEVTVLNSRSVAECYATLSILDYDSSMEDAVLLSHDTLSNICSLSIHHATKNVTFGGTEIVQNEFFAISEKTLLGVSASLEEIVISTVDAALKEHDCAVLTLFCGKYIASEYADHLAEKIEELGYDIEIAIVPTYETVYDVTITFE